MLAKILLLLGCAAGLYALVFGLRRPKAPQWAAGQRATWLLAAFCAACWLAGLACALLWLGGRTEPLEPLIGLGLGLLVLAGAAGLLAAVKALR